jgi:hypothetical protein
MTSITGWALLTWLKITAALGLCVLGVWLFADTPGYTVLAVIVAGIVEIWSVKALAKEWASEARTCWWWTT